MIVKKVASKGSGSFRGLANYILDVHKIHKDKVENINFTHCGFENIEDNIDLIENTQKLNASDADKTMHLIISFQEDEKPTKEQLADIEEEMLRSIGLEDHQRLSVTHTNTNNYHFHIAINRVKDGQREDPFRDIPKLQKKAAELEEKHFLKKDNHIPNWILAEQNRKTNEQNITKEIIYESKRANRRAEHTKDNGVLHILQRINQKFRGRSTSGSRTDSLRNLSGIDMVHDKGRAQVLLSPDECDSLQRRGRGDNQLRRKRAGNSIPFGGASRNVKAHSGITNLNDWIRENVLEDLKQILADKDSGWQELHTTLAKYNLELKERGNGFVLQDKTRKLYVKASSISRELSRAKLIAKYGQFKPGTNINIKPEIFFGKERTDFWEKYQAEMQASKETKEQGREELKKQYFNQKERIKAKYERKINALKINKALNRFVKRAAYQTFFASQRVELKEAYENYQLSGAILNKENRHITYKEYLIREALRGNSKALATLRYQKPPKPKEDDNTVGGKINHQLYTTKKPLITKRGFVVYRLDADNDQSKIIDKGNHMKIVNTSDAALLKALEMARTKYGREVDINGSEEFKIKVISLVADNKIDMKFKDAKMQQALNAATSQTKTKEQKIKKSGLEM